MSGAALLRKKPNSYDNSYDSLLLHFNGVEGGTTFIESSASNATFTTSGTVTTSALAAKFGATGCKVATGNINTPHNATQNLGTGNWCFDVWITIPTTPTAFPVICTKGPVASAGTWTIYYATSGSLTNLYVSLGLVNIINALATGLTRGVPFHLEVSKTAGRLYVFRDGIIYANQGDGNTWNAGTNIFYIGGQGSYTLGNGASYPGYIDELRLRKGIGGHTANFTPPAAPYGS